jgi:hypothetical protein
VQYPQPYGPPPPRSGPSVALVLGIVGGLFALVLVACVLAGVAIGFQRARARARASVGPSAADAAAAFTQTYPSKNGLVVAHYPADFAAKSIDDSTIVLARNLPDGTDEIVQIGAVERPISDDPSEFARVLLVAMAKNIEAAGDTWTETSRRTGACFRSYPGIAVEGTFVAGKKTPEHVRACFFIDSNRGYEIKSVVPAKNETAQLPLLQSILGATEIK